MQYAPLARPPLSPIPRRRRRCAAFAARALPPHRVSGNQCGGNLRKENRQREIPRRDTRPPHPARGIMQPVGFSGRTGQRHRGQIHTAHGRRNSGKNPPLRVSLPRHRGWSFSTLAPRWPSTRRDVPPTSRQAGSAHLPARHAPRRPIGKGRVRRADGGVHIRLRQRHIHGPRHDLRNLRQYPTVVQIKPRGCSPRSG